MKTKKYFVTKTSLLALISASYLLAAGFAGSAAWAGKTEISDDDGRPVDAPEEKQGEKEARKYFKKAPDSQSDSPVPTEAHHKYVSGTLDPEDHYLMIHLGGFLSSDSYQWGNTTHVSSPGRLTGGVTYRLGPVGRLADWGIRGDFIGYQFPDGNALNFAIMPMLLFPDAGSNFPLYFGIGLGPGVFFEQINGQSSLSLNYEMVAGVRFFDVIGDTGFFAETGLKNELHILSQGQFNGFFLALGALFVF